MVTALSPLYTREHRDYLGHTVNGRNEGRTGCLDINALLPREEASSAL